MYGSGCVIKIILKNFRYGTAVKYNFMYDNLAAMPNGSDATAFWQTCLGTVSHIS